MTPEYIREQLDHLDLLPDKEKEAQYETLRKELLSLIHLAPLERFYCLRELENYEREL